eukprot:TRINITY_DN1650_c0_g1_i1.p1 TRINITY_DN1650_c0_g1~~TRINITY_DN1650_c0_g1_i1.p1  ORF type:complete len:231 (+),score=52.33 TRINITY_DN1650_c0_g1_i1:252-944(+)
MVRKWSCCSGLDSDALGCMVTRHKEDKKTSAILSKFERSLSMLPPSTMVIQPPPEPTKITAPVPEKEEETEIFKRGQDGVLYFKYRINPSVDTLAGVAVKHKISTKKLKALNALWNDSEFYGRSYVLVPWEESKPIPDQSDVMRAEEEARKRNLVRRFSQEQGVTLDEALWYLDDNEYDYKTAVLMRQEDLEWEKGQKELKSTLITTQKKPELTQLTQTHDRGCFGEMFA